MLDLSQFCGVLNHGTSRNYIRFRQWRRMHVLISPRNEEHRVCAGE